MHWTIFWFLYFADQHIPPVHMRGLNCQHYSQHASNMTELAWYEIAGPSVLLCHLLELPSNESKLKGKYESIFFHDLQPSSISFTLFRSLKLFFKSCCHIRVFQNYWMILFGLTYCLAAIFTLLPTLVNWYLMLKFLVWPSLCSSKFQYAQNCNPF